MSLRARFARACTLAVLAVSGCSERGAAEGAGGAGGEAGAGQGGGAAGAGGEAATCLPGTVCVLALPFHADGDTTGS
ncbi:MAG: hypothetical protein IT373_03895, partial [Polyangiaceae bacterium]|nr:hypothetical protein [Polyangiaceae bacterium]